MIVAAPHVASPSLPTIGPLPWLRLNLILSDMQGRWRRVTGSYSNKKCILCKSFVFVSCFSYKNFIRKLIIITFQQLIPIKICNKYAMSFSFLLCLPFMRMPEWRFCMCVYAWNRNGTTNSTTTIAIRKYLHVKILKLERYNKQRR